jgi:hypothetical protein
MTLLTTQQVVKPKLQWTPVSVSASDTITADPAATLLLFVFNGGGSTDNITVSDGGSSPAGNPATSYATSVANGTNAVIPLSPALVNASTGLITVTHSFTTSVTCAVLRNT